MKPQIPRLVVEIGSLKQGREVGSENYKDAVFKQLHGYMVAVAGPSQKWAVKLPTRLRPLGLAIVGTEVAFCTPRMYNGHVAWTANCGGTRKVKWFSLYGPEFLRAINRLADASTQAAIVAKAERCRVEAEERARVAAEKQARDTELVAKGKKSSLPRRVQPDRAGKGGKSSGGAGGSKGKQPTNASAGPRR